MAMTRRTFWKKATRTPLCWIKRDKGGGFGKPFICNTLQIEKEENKFVLVYGFNPVYKFETEEDAVVKAKQIMGVDKDNGRRIGYKEIDLDGWGMVIVLNERGYFKYENRYK